MQAPRQESGEKGYTGGVALPVGSVPRPGDEALCLEAVGGEGTWERGREGGRDLKGERASERLVKKTLLLLARSRAFHFH